MWCWETRMSEKRACGERWWVPGRAGASRQCPRKPPRRRSDSKLRVHPGWSATPSAADLACMAEEPAAAPVYAPSCARACRRWLRGGIVVHRCRCAARPGLAEGVGSSTGIGRHCGHSCGIWSRRQLKGRLDIGACWRGNGHRLRSVPGSRDGSPRAARRGRGGRAESDDGPPRGDCEYTRRGLLLVGSGTAMVVECRVSARARRWASCR